jgi:hypothetical protein
LGAGGAADQGGGGDRSDPGLGEQLGSQRVDQLGEFAFELAL